MIAAVLDATIEGGFPSPAIGWPHVHPLIHSRLVNLPFGDPGVYVEFMFERHAMLFDLGDLQLLSDRALLRVGHVFVSHTHMDHFTGLDRIVRICLGRDKVLRLFGPPGFIERVVHRLASYTWNLVGNYAADLTLEVSELHPDGDLRSARLRCREGFRADRRDGSRARNGILVDSPGYRIRAAILDHGIPCLGYALEQTRHVNVWKNRVEEMGFRVGPWLRELKQAILRDEPADRPFRVQWREDGAVREAVHPLGELRDRLTHTEPGQKLAYVTDVAWTAANRAAIVDLARDADLLYIEAPFLDEDAEIAARKNHLTAAQAGRLARTAGVRRVEPFHFSPRYSEREADLRAEVERHFAGTAARREATE